MRLYDLFEEVRIGHNQSHIEDVRIPGEKSYDGSKPVGFVVFLKSGKVIIYGWGHHNTIPWSDLLAKLRSEIDTDIHSDYTEIAIYRNGFKLGERMDDARWPAVRTSLTPENKKIVQALLDHGLATRETPIWIGNWARSNEGGQPIGSVGKILARSDKPSRVTLYHGTTSYRWEIIQKTGLQPMAVNDRIWKKDTMLAAVYLTMNVNTARYYASKAVNVDRARRNWPNDGVLKPVVLAVTMGAADMKKLVADDDHLRKNPDGDPTDWLKSLAYQAQVAYVGSIPPSRIKQID